MGKTSFGKTILKHAGLLATAAVMTTAAQADENQLARDLKFIQELEKENLDTFIIPFVNDRIKENPDETDRYKIAIAGVYIKAGKANDANAIITKITKSSKYYNSGNFIIGKTATEKGDYKTAIKSLNEYVEALKTKKEKSKSEDDEFRVAVSYLAHAYKQTNLPDKAAEVMTYLSEDPRESQLLAIDTKVDAAENLKKEEMISRKKSNWRDIAKKAIVDYENLLWDPDAIALFALVGSGRASYLLDDYKKALYFLSQQPERFEAYDLEFKKQKQTSFAPGTHARFWIGKTFLAMAQKEKDQKEKISLYIKALKKYLYVVMECPEFPKVSDAYSDLIYCQSELKTLGKKVTLPSNLKQPQIKKEVVSLTPGDADKFFKEKSYDKAIPILLNAITINRTKEGIEDSLYKLGYSYASTNQSLEAIAVADYLAGAFPKFDNAPLLLLQMGQLFSKAKKAKDATLAYEIYIEQAPTHEYAADIALKLAKETYDSAVKAAKDADTFKGSVRDKKIEDSIKMFLDSIPQYDRVINNYGNRLERVEQAYNLKAQSYASAKEFTKAAETYAKYSELSITKDKLAKAKLSIGDFYMKAGDKLTEDAKALREAAFSFPADSDGRKAKLTDADKKDKEASADYTLAMKNLKELVDDWMKPNGKVGTLPTAELRKVLPDALILLATAYDASKEKKNAIETFKKFVAIDPKSSKVPPCMARMGLLYYELNDYATSSKILEDLAQKFPDSKEAKNAYYNLGRNMYEIGNYVKCFEVFNKLFSQKIDVSPSNLRWIASSLYDCGATHPKEGAVLSLKAAKMLLELVKNADKNMALWVGDKAALAMKTEPAEKAKALSMIKQKILFDAGAAAFYTGDASSTVKYITDLLTLEKNTPYLYKALFIRADAYVALKDYDNARKDLSEISMGALTTQRDALASESKCKIGQTYMLQKDYLKAFNAYSLIAKSLNALNLGEGEIYPPNLTAEDIEKLKDERKKEMAWIEEAVYQGAICAAKLGQKADAESLTTLYLKHFPSGTYAKKILSLPAPEGANK